MPLDVVAFGVTLQLAPAYKRLQVALDEKSPTYAPPTFVRVTPAPWVTPDVGSD